MIGSILSGVLFNLFGRQMCAIIFLLIIGFSDALTPYSPNIWFLYTLSVFKGLSCGGFNTAQVVWIIEIWKQESAPYIHALLFFISLGSFITPLVNRQYLFDYKNGYCLREQNKQNSDFIQNITHYQQLEQSFGNYSVSQNFQNFAQLFNHSFSDYYQLILETNSKNLSNFEKNVLKNSKECPKELLLNIPYVCEGFLALCGSGLLFIIYIYQKEQQNSENVSQKREKKKMSFSDRFLSEDESIDSLKSWRKSFFIITGSILLSSYIGMEFANFQLLATFSRFTDLKLSGIENL
jgi:hypothetical protein